MGADTELLAVVVHVPFQVEYADAVFELKVVEFACVGEVKVGTAPDEVIFGSAETNAEPLVGDAVAGPDHSVHDPFQGPVHEPVHAPVQLGAVVGPDIFIAEIAERMLDVKFWVTVIVVKAP